ncbi:MAG TPA: hypothetical protein VJU87_04420, partial [Gemmatimonadaceae bacterium]|nr:hypothetical protein [Gemmatimonadaceae bacterium]
PSILASVLFRSDGYHLGVGDCCDLARTSALYPAAPIPAVSPRPVAAVAAEDTSAIHGYSPWRTLWPRYWWPSLPDGLHGKSRIALETSGSDVVGRHAYAAGIAFPRDNSGVTWSAAYEYRGLGLPILDAFADQDWSLAGAIVDQGPPERTLSEIHQRSRDAEVTATWLRPRVRRSLSLTAGVGAEQTRNVLVPGLPSGVRLRDPSFLDARTYPSVIAALGWSNAQRPPFSISPEDGLAFAGTARERWRADSTAASSLSLVGTGSLYKSLDLPGYAHHVLALRGAAGIVGVNNPGYLDVGGTSGTPVTLIAEYTLGEGRRTFGVRGFEAGSLLGDRALTGTIEYRAPLVRAGRGLGLLPVFFDRSSLTLFYDAGSAWCATIVAVGNLCTADQQSAFDIGARRWIAAAGAELNITAAVLSWDSPYRFRFGVAHPVHADVLFGNPASVSWYFATGLSF